MKELRLLLGLSLLYGATSAAQDIEESLDADPNGTVSVSNTSGSVEVRGWSRNEVRVEGELGSAVEELEFERRSDEVVIKVRVPRNNSRSISSDLTISVPQASSLRVGTVSADIDVTGLEGEQELNTVSGDVTAEVFAAEVDVETVSGDIEVQGDDQELEVELGSVSGDVDAQNIAGKATLTSVSGDLAIIDSRLGRVRLNTTNGDIVYRAGLVNSGRMDVETINGTVDIEFEGEISARFNIETFNGDIRNCFGPEAEKTSRYTPGSELIFNEGDGEGRVNINTLNGTVRLCKD